MHLNTPEDAMPWVGLYVCVASLICTLAMAADAFSGFREGKLWFPCRFLTLNAASITVIAIAMKIPVDLTTMRPYSDDIVAKVDSIIFLVIILANFLPSLGLMDDKELLFNIIALGILIITIFVNLSIEIVTEVFYIQSCGSLILILWPFSVALMVPTTRRILEHHYQELNEVASNHHASSFSSKELMHNINKYWMMAETGNPQLVIACSHISSAYGVMCPLIALKSSMALVDELRELKYSFGQSDYKWSVKVILIVQTIGIVVGSIAPTFRFFYSISYFSLSKKRSVNHLNMFRVEGYWTQRLKQWKRSHIYSCIPGQHCKKVFHIFKNMVLNICIAFQMMVVVLCKLICLVPRSFIILLSCCWYFFKSFFKRFKKDSNASMSNVRSDMNEYTKYIIQIEDKAKLSEKKLRKTLSSITRLLRVSEEKESRILLKLLQKSTSFNGVVEFDNECVLPLHSEDIQNSWSLITVTLTAIVVGLPNIANIHVERLLASMREGLQFVRHIEDNLNENSNSVRSRKAARRVWKEVEVYRTWLQIDLLNKARKGKTSKKIIQWLSDEAVKIVIRFKIAKKRSIDDSLHKFLVATSMYRISQTILLHCNEQVNWPTDEELFEWISTILADLLLACFTNLPRVITMKCHHNKIEKRVDSIRSAAQLLGKSKKILKILKTRQLPNLDVDSMAYIDKWHALPKSEIPNGTSLTRIQPASSSSSESLVVTIMQ